MSDHVYMTCIEYSVYGPILGAAGTVLCLESTKKCCGYVTCFSSQDIRRGVTSMCSSIHIGLFCLVYNRKPHKSPVHASQELPMGAYELYGIVGQHCSDWGQWLIVV